MAWAAPKAQRRDSRVGRIALCLLMVAGRRSRRVSRVAGTEAIHMRCGPARATPSVTAGRRNQDAEAVAARLLEIIALLCRIERRMTAAGVTDWVAYLDLLRAGKGESERCREIELLARDLLINVTHFFRDASDIDKDAVRIARIGLYPESIAGEVSPARLVGHVS